MTILSDDIVEQGARALYEAGPRIEWHEATEASKAVYRQHARACIEAVRPAILEEAAKVADNFEPKPTPGHEYLEDWQRGAAYTVALAIRNLKPKEEGNG